MSDSIRTSILKSLKSPLMEGYRETKQDELIQFTEDEKKAVRQLRESAVFQAYPKDELDRHEYKYLMGRICTVPISICERAANKIARCQELGLFDADLNWNEEKASQLCEGMADTAKDDTQADDHGMYGIGDGADKEEPKGDADKGCAQKADHGDHSHTAKDSDGYMDEAAMVARRKALKESRRQLKEERRKLKESIRALKAKGVNETQDPTLTALKVEASKLDSKIAKISESLGDREESHCPDEHDDADDKKKDMSFPPKKMGEKKMKEGVDKDPTPAETKAPSPTNDKNTAATDAALKDGKKQMENTAGENDSGSTTEDPHGEKTGEGAPGSKSEKPTDKGEVPPEHPDYAKAREEDPAHDEKNKGPAKAVNEDFASVEKRLCETLESKGYQKGTPQYERAYRRGFDLWITERAKSQNARK